MKGMVGLIVNAVACLFMLAFIVIFCFPVSSPEIPTSYFRMLTTVKFAMPVEVDTMSKQYSYFVSVTWLT